MLRLFGLSRVGDRRVGAVNTCYRRKGVQFQRRSFRNEGYNHANCSLQAIAGTGWRTLALPDSVAMAYSSPNGLDVIWISFSTEVSVVVGRESYRSTARQP